MAESRKFSVHPQMIYSLIKAQAGTLSKACLEGVMNSVDSLSSTVWIDIDAEKIIIKDDGHGFRSLAEIEECFEVFGFPHEEGARMYGQFGIGRAQLWSFSSAIWRTNTFMMDVDIKNRGLDYKLLENQDQVNGLTIVSRFYTPMSTQEIMAFKQELKELALFTQIPVILNGERINITPDSIKWDFETEDAYIKLVDKSQLTVYNLGVMVRHYPSHQVGSGGLVVTKPGVKLALNMARADILVAECEVWRRIKPYIQKKSDEKVRRKVTKLSSAELENRATRFLSGELDYMDVSEIKLITDITNRSHTIEGFMGQDRGVRRLKIITTALEGSNLGDRAHTSKAAFVVHPETFARFGVETFDEFHKVLMERMASSEATARHWWYTSFLEHSRFEGDIHKAVPTLNEGYEILPCKDWTKYEKGVVSALRKVDYQLRNHLKDMGCSEKLQAERELAVGMSDTANAWTDGVARIVFNRAFLEEAHSGIGGFMHILTTFAHEYLHEDSSSGTHIHEETFYQRFHTALNSTDMGNMAFTAYRYYVSYLGNVGLKPTKKLLSALNLVEVTDRTIPEQDTVLLLQAA